MIARNRLPSVPLGDFPSARWDRLRADIDEFLASPWAAKAPCLGWDELVWVSFDMVWWVREDCEAARAVKPSDHLIGRAVDYLAIAATVPGWREGEEAAAVHGASYSRPDDAVLVEVGSFLGRSTILLAGARKLRGSGKVYCVDPFDCSGDDFSVPFYAQILAEQGGGSLREQFDRNIDRAGLTDWVQVLPRRAVDAAMEWRAPVDLLLLDGDQSPKGAREAFDAWLPHLKSGGVLIMGNSTPRNYEKTHDGNWLIASSEIVYPQFIDPKRVGTATIAIKA
jgi:MMP 1-O-methyltransferase